MQSEEEGANMSKKVALVLGCGGMDGSYLCEILVGKGYEVHGVYRRTSYNNLSRLGSTLRNIHLHKGDLSDGPSIERIIRQVLPDEIYNEADQDHVGYSKETPQVSLDITTGAVFRLLETILAVRRTNIVCLPYNPKIFQPVSATMFGNSVPPQNERTPFTPASPYACAKLAAYYLCQHYRREHGMFVSCGIMFNHESPRRGPDYLLQRIVRQAKLISQGKEDKIQLYNTEMEVDIGYAPDYMDAAWRILQLDKPTDLVVGTGYPAAIYEFARWALECVGISGKSSKYIEHCGDSKFRNEPTLVGNWAKLQELTGWRPTHYRKGLVKILVDNIKEDM